MDRVKAADSSSVVFPKLGTGDPRASVRVTSMFPGFCLLIKTNIVRDW